MAVHHMGDGTVIVLLGGRHFPSGTEAGVTSPGTGCLRGSLMTVLLTQVGDGQPLPGAGLAGMLD